MSSPSRSRRKRARKACEPCRDRKRKCDGNQPCESCVRNKYSCEFVSPRLVTQHVGRPQVSLEHAPPVVSEPILLGQATTFSDNVSNDQLPSADANSGAAFVRKLALALDPSNAPRPHMFAWNLFLGARMPGHSPRVRIVTDIISAQEMVRLSSIYAGTVDPCYGFIDHDLFQQRLHYRWNHVAIENAYDAVLCGVAALGFLFSSTMGQSEEMDLAETARHILERAAEHQPSIDVVTGWVLRVAYLRMTATPHVTWMASCTLMHTIEASGIHMMQQALTASGEIEQETTLDLSRRVVGIARHLNTWISYDLGRTRASLPHSQFEIPAPKAGDYTRELLSILPLSESLDTEKQYDCSALKHALHSLLGQSHTQPPSVLAQTNLALLLLRRLRSLDFYLSGNLLEGVLRLTSRAMNSARIMLDSGDPWHHIVNVPFQIVCILLVIDTSASLSQLATALNVLSNIACKYATRAATEALKTASFLTLLHQRRKDADAKTLGAIIQKHAPSAATGMEVTETPPVLPGDPNEPSWLTNFLTDVPGLQDFDIGLFLNENGTIDPSTLAF